MIAYAVGALIGAITGTLAYHYAAKWTGQCPACNRKDRP